MGASAIDHHIFTRPARLQRGYAPSIRTSLAMLVLACILPIALMAGFLILRFYEQEQTQATLRAIGRARAMVATVDRDFAGTESALLALATSHRLVNDDLAGFHARATEAIANINADSIVVVDLSGQLLLSTRRPFGTPLPKLKSTPLLERVLRTGKPGVSDLYVGPIVGSLIYTIGVPVKRNGLTVFTLNATASPTQLSSVLSDQAFPGSWRATITDSKGSIAARTHDNRRYVGKPVHPDLLRQMSMNNEGSFETTTLDGIPAITVYSRSPLTNWAATIAMPLEDLTAGLRRTLNLLILATAAALAIALTLAWFIARGVADSITALTEPALALATGVALDIPHFSFKEANVMGVALKNAAKALRQSQYDAHHDVLTGLPNRALLHTVVAQQLALCERTATTLAMLYIDLDGFKAVNDNHGHLAGDQLLREVSQRIRGAIRDSDIAARLGGDEFAIALYGSDLAHAGEFASRLIDTLATEAYRLGDIEARISASIGVAAYPASAREIDTLMKKADQAMYKAKSLGKGRHCVASP